MLALVHVGWLHWQTWLVRQGQGCMLWRAYQPRLTAGQLQDKHVVVVVVLHQALGTCRQAMRRQRVGEAGLSHLMTRVCLFTCVGLKTVNMLNMPSTHCAMWCQQQAPRSALTLAGGLCQRLIGTLLDAPNTKRHKALPEAHITHQLV